MLIASFINDFSGIWDDTLWSVKHIPITAGRLIVALTVVVIGMLVSRLLCRWLKEYMEKRSRLSPTGVNAVTRLTLYFLLLTWIIMGLDVLHIPLTTFAFLGGSLALGVGFGAKDIISNFISGFIIMAERPIKIGDVIEIEGEIGKIETIGIRSTRIHTENNVHIIVPNSTFLSNMIINWTLQDNMVLTPIEVGVAYGTDLEQATRIMIEAARNTEGVLATEEPFVLFWEIGNSALNFQVYFASIVHNKMERWTMQSRVRYSVVEALTAAGIVIAFPQRDVHLDTSRPLEVRLSSSPGTAPAQD